VAETSALQESLAKLPVTAGAQAAQLEGLSGEMQRVQQLETPRRARRPGPCRRRCGSPVALRRPARRCCWPLSSRLDVLGVAAGKVASWPAPRRRHPLQHPAFGGLVFRVAAATHGRATVDPFAKRGEAAALGSAGGCGPVSGR